MAKLSFTKLGLKKNQEIKTLNFNDQVIEVKQYLPWEDKMGFINDILMKSASEGLSVFIYDPSRIEVYYVLNIITNYTNITFTDKQLENPLAIYNLFVGNDLYKQIVDLIPTAELVSIHEWLNKIQNDISDYNRSVLGVLDAMKTDQTQTSNLIDEIIAKVNSGEFKNTLETLKPALGETILNN